MHSSASLAAGTGVPVPALWADLGRYAPRSVALCASWVGVARCFIVRVAWLAAAAVAPTAVRAVALAALSDAVGCE